MQKKLTIPVDAANSALNRVQVVSRTGQATRLYPAEACVTLNGEQRKAMADQIATASKLRLRSRLRWRTIDGVLAIERGVCPQLGFSCLPSE